MMRRCDLRSARDVVDMVAQRNEQIEEELGVAVEHLELHGAAALEGAAAADDEGEVVRAQLGVGVGRVRVGVPGRGQDGARLDAGLCSHVLGLGRERDNLEKSAYEDPACAARPASIPRGRTSRQRSRWPCP